MAAEKSDIAQSVKDLTCICDSIVMNGMIVEDEVSSAFLNARKAENVKVPKLKCLLVC